MDVRFINPFIHSITNVFETMVHAKVKVGKPFLKQDETTEADVSGVIGFSGEAAGCVVLSFPSEVACKAASSFAGIEIDQNHPDFADAIGELANMVAGNAKREFHGMSVSISLPSVIIGKQHTVLQSREFPRIVIPCETSLGSVYIEVGMQVERAASAAPAATSGATK